MKSTSVDVDNVKVVHGLGNLPKLILTSVHGRYVHCLVFQFFFSYEYIYMYTYLKKNTE